MIEAISLSISSRALNQSMMCNLLTCCEASRSLPLPLLIKLQVVQRFARLQLQHSSRFQSWQERRRSHCIRGTCTSCREHEQTRGRPNWKAQDCKRRRRRRESRRSRNTRRKREKQQLES